jgi:hypothetical protein
MFEISLDDVGADITTTYGEIRIGEFSERFEVALEYWCESDYREQWIQALKSCCIDKKKSALITSITSPKTANFVFWWLLYPLDGEIIIQNQILMLDELQVPFNLEYPSEHIPIRNTLTEDGDEVSEWSVAYSDIEDFLKRAG